MRLRKTKRDYQTLSVLVRSLDRITTAALYRAITYELGQSVLLSKRERTNKRRQIEALARRHLFYYQIREENGSIGHDSKRLVKR